MITCTVGSVLQTITYTYDTAWKDKLAKYNGTAITYDAIGNPLTDGTWTYTWEKGRQLKQMTKSGTTATFLYNADGLRIRKTVGSTVTNYTLHGKNIVHMTQGSNTLHFWYDAQNRPAIVQFNGTKYGYIHNLQGDVIGLIDSNGTEVVKYVYDAWGKILSTTGSLASTLGAIQPFRYRSYVFDQETGLYYLRSRYYNPTWQRFVNSDTILCENTFYYCCDDPVNLVDKNGRYATSAFVKRGEQVPILDPNASEFVSLYSSVTGDTSLMVTALTDAYKMTSVMYEVKSEYIPSKKERIRLINDAIGDGTDILSYVLSAAYSGIIYFITGIVVNPVENTDTFNAILSLGTIQTSNILDNYVEDDNTGHYHHTYCLYVRGGGIRKQRDNFYITICETNVHSTEVYHCPQIF